MGVIVTAVFVLVGGLSIGLLSMITRTAWAAFVPGACSDDAVLLRGAWRDARAGALLTFVVVLAGLLDG